MALSTILVFSTFTVVSAEALSSQGSDSLEYRGSS